MKKLGRMAEKLYFFLNYSVQIFLNLSSSDESLKRIEKLREKATNGFEDDSNKICSDFKMIMNDLNKSINTEVNKLKELAHES